MTIVSSVSCLMMLVDDQNPVSIRNDYKKSTWKQINQYRPTFPTGTLYCAKGNYEFGISRVIKSLEPYNKKLGTDTWFYAKRCFLSLIENLAKHMISVRDSVIQVCIALSLRRELIPTFVYFIVSLSLYLPLSLRRSASSSWNTARFTVGT